MEEGSSDLLHLLNDRLLIMVNEKKATDLLPHVDKRTGGLILTGADAPTHCRHLRNSQPGTVVAVDLAGHEHGVATATRPFGYRAKNGWHAPDLAGVEEILNGQLANKAAFAVTPTAFIPRDATGDARVLKAVINQANQLERTDTVVLLPCSWRWLTGDSLEHLIRQVRASRHPVSLIMQHWRDPLKATGVIEGLRQLCRSCPQLSLWRTDLAAFDAIAHGAIGAEVGVTAALRHGMAPRTDSGGGGGMPYPVVLVRDLLEYRRVTALQHWEAHIGPWPCECRVCEGRSLTRFENSPAAVPEPQWHTACELYALHDELTSTHAGWERLLWWRQMVADAIERHHHLSTRLGEEVPHTLRSSTTGSSRVRRRFRRADRGGHCGESRPAESSEPDSPTFRGSGDDGEQPVLGASRCLVRAARCARRLGPAGGSPPVYFLAHHDAGGRPVEVGVGPAARVPAVSPPLAGTMT